MPDERPVGDLIHVGPSTREWWRTAVIYQIYPRSFASVNDDGVGDLAGITGRLPYLRDLGLMRSGSRRSTRHRRRMRVTTWPTTSTSIRCSAHWPMPTS